MFIRDFETRDLNSVVDLSLRAWEPVFGSIKESMQLEVYQHFFPDWRSEQQAAVEAVCTGGEAKVWVADDNGDIAGFVAVHRRSPTFGEIYMIAVDPRQQRKGIAAALTEHAVAWMRGEGMVVAMVETGGDPGHAPARQLYESTGFRLWPVSRYFRLLS
jgi:GNAT superfamily N-acetyltransferase